MSEAIGDVPRTKQDPTLRARRLGIQTSGEPVVFMRSDCFVCRSEGLSARSQVLLSANGRETVATLYHVSSDLLAGDEAGLSEDAWAHLQVSDGDPLVARHPDPVESLAAVRSRVHGNRLDDPALRSILADVVDRERGAGARRPDGAYFGLWQLTEKLNLALAAGLALPVLGAIGYRPGTVQAAMGPLSTMYAIVPCALKLLAVAILWFAPIDRTVRSNPALQGGSQS